MSEAAASRLYRGCTVVRLLSGYFFMSVLGCEKN